MAKKEKIPTNAPIPTESDEKAYIVRLTAKEMQCLANACAGFYNVANRDKYHISPEQTVAISSAMHKFKEAEKRGVDIQVVGAH